MPESKELTGIEDLTVDPQNANKGTQRGLGMLEHSLSTLGAGRSIVVDKAGRVIAGNKTLEAAAGLGLDIEVVKTDGHKLLVVQREDLDLEDGDRARSLAYADNRTSEVGLEWDVERLAADLDAGLDLGDFWGAEELLELSESVGKLVPVDLKAPTMAWVLIGIPIERFGEVAEGVEHIACIDGVFCETTVSDDD